MLFKNITIVDDQFKIKEKMYVVTTEDKITYIGDVCPEGDFGRVYDGKGKLLMSGFVNTHEIIRYNPMDFILAL